MPIEGTRIRLREPRKSDIPFRVQSKNDLETQGWNQTLPLDFTEEMYEKVYDKKELSYSKSRGEFAIEEIESGKYVGTIAYSGLKPRFSAVIGIGLLKEFFRKGYGYEAHELLLEFLFQELGLRVLYWYTTSQNIGSIKLAEKSGYQIAIRSREAVFKGGKRYDGLTLELLREDYFARHPELTDELPEL